MDRKIITPKRLRDNSIQADFIRQSLNSDFISLFCIGGSTIRAFHKETTYKKHTPTSIFQSWVSKNLNGNLKNEMEKNRGDDNGFLKFKDIYLRRLTKYWKSYCGCNYELKFYQKNKLIDLFFKFLTLWNELTVAQRQWLFKNINVPLDSLILKELRKHNNKKIVRDLRISKSNTIGMSWVKKENYQPIQNAIREIIGYSRPLIIFDLIVWHHDRFDLKLVAK
jgi:hypothetical protein